MFVKRPSWGDGISWEHHIQEVLDGHRLKGDTIFYKYDENNEILQHMKKYLGDFKGKKLLDIGSFIGRWIEFYKGAGFDYTAVEQSSEAVKVALQYHPDDKFLNMMSWDMKFQEEFDMVISMAVLQHNTNEEKKKIIPRIYDATKFGGIFFMTESTVINETRTQHTYDGWLKLVEGSGFKFLESWGFNDKLLDEFYLFKKI